MRIALAPLYCVFGIRKQLPDELPHSPSLCRVVTVFSRHCEHCQSADNGRSEAYRDQHHEAAHATRTQELAFGFFGQASVNRRLA